MSAGSRNNFCNHLKRTAKTIGLRYSMLRVLEECDNVAADFRADPVHDLRVSLRRCRSVADGMMAMDPDPQWKSMKKSGKKLFQSLGALRDVQIMMEWIHKLEVAQAPAPAFPEPPWSGNVGRAAPAPASAIDPAAMLLQILKDRESQHKQDAHVALEQFNRKLWLQWSASLSNRVARIRPGSAVFKHLALERWTTARKLHTRAIRSGSDVAFHTLRIGIKRFRYIVENFLPEEHNLWSGDLKHMQDLLGEVHDLDVLWATAISCHIFPDETSRETWHKKILEERTKRIDEYRERTTGSESRWKVWRAGLPQGKEIQAFATRRMKLWAKALDPDFPHSERVAGFALALYDGLAAGGLLRAGSSLNGAEKDARESLYAAALLHDVGKAKGNTGHHKKSLELIKRHGTPLGWKADCLNRVAVVARFHCGALPTRRHPELCDLPSDEQSTIIRLAAILRLANALDVAHDGRIKEITIENAAAPRKNHRPGTNGFSRKSSPLLRNEALVILAQGFADGTPTAQAVAAERYLLETVLRRPILVKAMRSSPIR